MKRRIEYEGDVSPEIEILKLENQCVAKVPKRKGSSGHYFSCNGNFCYKLRDGSLVIDSLRVKANYEHKSIRCDLETNTHIFVAISIPETS